MCRKRQHFPKDSRSNRTVIINILINCGSKEAIKFVKQLSEKNLLPADEGSKDDNNNVVMISKPINF